MNKSIKQLEPIKDIASLESAIRQHQNLDKSHAHKRFWYRGQPNHEWRLRPTVYRDKFMPIDTSIINASQREKDCLNTERHLSQDFRTHIAGFSVNKYDMADLYFLQRHYGMPTRLLDWTTNPLAALYFAVNDDGEKSKPGMLFAMDAFKMSKAAMGAGRGIATPRNPTLTRALKIILAWDDHEKFDFKVIPVMPDHSDIRIGQQSSCFTFHGPDGPELTPDMNPTLACMQVPESCKGQLRDQLRLFGFNDFSMYGDLTSLARHLTDRYTWRQPVDGTQSAP